MKKITLLLILGIILSFNVVSAESIKTYNTAANFVEVSKSFSSKTLINTLTPLIYVNMTGSVYEPNGQNITFVSSSTVMGWVIYNSRDLYFYPTVPAATTISFRLSVDGVAFDAIRYLSYSVSGSSPTPVTCTETCTDDGIVIYSIPSVFSPDSCSNHILEIKTDDPTCVPVVPGAPSSKPTIKSVEGITVTRSFERSITAKAKIFQIACEGSGTMIVDMDGYTSYDVYHLGRYVETSTEAEYEINTCSEWIFDPTGYIAECRGTKTTVFAAMGLISMMTLIFIGFSMVKIFNGGDYSIEVIYTLIGFSLAVIIGIVVLSQMSGALCGV